MSVKESALPPSVMYVKNGPGGKWLGRAGGKWWPVAQKQKQIHAGWKRIPPKDIRKADAAEIKRLYWRFYPKKNRKGRTADLNALLHLLNRPSRHIWITFEDGYLWWCTVHDRAESSERDAPSRGHFWLTCKRPWSKHSINGTLLSKTDLPGTVTKVAGFKATVCKPDAWKEILRVIQDQPNPVTSKTRRAREVYEQSIKPLIQDLSPQDFELLIDLILLRSGWGRVSRSGGIQEGIDLDVENPATGEHAYVQVKGEAGQKEFTDHLGRFRKRREKFARMIFAVHKPRGQMHAPRDPAVQIWTGDKIAQLVVRLGLGERLERMHA